MTIQIYDRVQETTVATGTGPITLLGAVAGYSSFASTVGVSNQTYYGIVDNTAHIWEVGIGTLTDSTTLSRDNVLSSTNSGELITLLGNTCVVFIDVPATKRIQLDSDTIGTNGMTTIYGDGSNLTNVHPSLPIHAVPNTTIISNDDGGQIFAVDANKNFKLTNRNGTGVIGIDGNNNVEIKQNGGQLIFGVDDDGNPVLKPVSGNATIGFDGSENPRLLATSGSGSVEFDGNNNPIIQNHLGVDVLAIDSNAHPYLTTGNAPGVSGGTIGFDSNLNPYITNLNGNQAFTIDSSTNRPAINNNVWPSNDFGDLSNDGSGNLAWQSRFRTINVQTGTSYTLAISDQLVTLDNSSAITVTIPAFSDVNFKNNTEIDFIQMGSGQVTISAAGGVNLYSYVNKVNIAGQYAGATLKMLSNDNWVLVGNLA